MNVQQIRDEIGKIDSLLSQVESDISKIEPDEVDITAMENEYSILISSLSNIPQSIPFDSLMEGEDNAPGPTAPDAFTFFGLVQAFIDDPIVIKVLAKLFTNVTGVTPTQLEDSLMYVERISDKTARALFIHSIIDRMVEKISVMNPASLGLACQLLLKHGGDLCNESLRNLIEDGCEIPFFLKIEIAFYLVNQASNASPESLRGLDLLLDESALFIEKLDSCVVSNRVCMQLIHLFVFKNRVVPNADKYIEKSVLQAGRRDDVHFLVIEISRMSHQQVNVATLSVVFDKLLSSSIPVYEVPGALSALIGLRLTSDRVLFDVVGIKKWISGISLKTVFVELVDFLIQTGDKSTGSSITRSIIERRDLYIDESSTDLLLKVLTLCAISSVGAGTIIPESIILLKKYSANFKTSELLNILFTVLLPSFEYSYSNGEIGETFKECIDHERVSQVLSLMGYEPDDSVMRTKTMVEGIFVDVCFPVQKVSILIERNAIYNVSGKQFGVVGMTNLKANILAHKKGYKVIIIVPQLYPDNKSLVNLLSGPLARISANSIFEFSEMISEIPRDNQKFKKIDINSTDRIDIGKFLLHVLKNSIHSQEISFTNLHSGDQFLTNLFLEFLSSYVVRSKDDIRIHFSRANFSTGAVNKLVESLNGIGNASNGFGVIDLKLGISDEQARSVVEDFIRLHPNSLIRVAIGGGPSGTNDKNVVFIA
jgi:hypothetical protein